jgi:hydroxymethylpyrimidine kinase/phosphomethylpyrimidine kinase
MIHILVIAGSDSCGGAGIQADVKTSARLGAHATTAITAITAQNSLGITAVHKVHASFISKQVETIIDDLMPSAVKVGMLYTTAAVREVARLIKRHNLKHVVVDPVFRASTGMELLDPGAISVMKDVLFPLTGVVTPNLDEAGILAGKKVDGVEEMVMAAKIIKQFGPDVVITGGHFEDRCVDLVFDGKDVHQFWGSKIYTQHTHGSGCVFSTALAVFLAEGKSLVKAAEMAHDFARNAIINGYECGKGAGPVKAG